MDRFLSDPKKELNIISFKAWFIKRPRFFLFSPLLQCYYLVVMTSQEIRKRFLDYFVRRDHLLIEQSSLVPEYDPTLLFTNSGMAPLKPYFLGVKPPPSERLVNIQRCLRTEDLDNIGDSSHHTFFQMLGSWSIGGYGKREAVELAFGLLTSKEEGFGFKVEDLYATVFSGDKNLPADSETANFWKEAGLPEKNIIERPFKDNFWVSGPTGPCGPCTEVLFDRGESLSCGENCGPECECGRFLEIWNAGVFMQYNRKAEGVYDKLPFLSVDTGAGLERLASVLQNKKSNYETDQFFPIIKLLEVISTNKYESPDIVRNLRIIADHLRASVFLAADGVTPSNTERGYVLRKLLRRAIESGLLLEINGYFVRSVAEKIIEMYRNDFPHLDASSDTVIRVLEDEEKIFALTLSRGKRYLESKAKKLDLKYSTMAVSMSGASQAAGEIAFTSFDEQGLPRSISEEFFKNYFKSEGAELKYIDFNLAYETRLKKQQEQARLANKKESYEPEKIKTAHTGAHLLNAALRSVLGKDLHQPAKRFRQNQSVTISTFPENSRRANLRLLRILLTKK